MCTVEVVNYTKILKNKEVLKNINYTFHGGTIYGLYGRNGSGKTMLLRAISGLIYTNKGELKVDGSILHDEIDFPSDLGLMIENMSLLPQYDAFTNLKLLAKIRKVATDEDIRQALEKVGLDANDKKKVKAYSLGMKQKLAIAQAIFEKPKILLLDEPTNALDEESMREVRSLFLAFKRQGCLIIIASHNKEDIAYLCDKVLYMQNGELSE